MQKPPLNSSASLLLMYTVIFLLCILFGALLKQIGVPGNFINLLMFAFVVGGYIFSGLFGKTMLLPVFQNAGRTGRPFYTGQAVAAGLISSSLFIFLAGDFYSTGTDALTIFSGFILGLALMAILFAAPVNRTQSPTLAGLIIPHEGSKLGRLLILVIVVITALLLLHVQFSTIGLISKMFFNISHHVAVIITAVTIGFCIILGGLQSLSIGRMIAYPILIICFLAPLVWIAYQITGNPLPQLSFGIGALQAISEVDQELLNAGLVEQSDVFDLTREGLNYDVFNHFSALLCIAFGTAAMPHLLQHMRVLPKARSARRTSVWALGFLLILITAIPAVAAFVKLDIYTSLLGLQLSQLDQEAIWLFELNQNGASIISICGDYITSASQALNACGVTGEYFLSSKDITVNPDMLLLSSGVLNELPDLMTTLLATGALVAIWSTADGLILVCANTITEDGYRALVRPKSPMGIRLFMSRFFIIVLISISTYLTLSIELDARFAFATSFALLTAGLFPALVCRIWLKHIDHRDVMIAVFLGVIVTTAMLWFSHYGTDVTALNGNEINFHLPMITDKIQPLSMGFIGMLVSFASAFALTKVQQMRSQEKANNKVKSDVPA